MIPGPRKSPDPDITSATAEADVYSPDRSVRITATARGDVTVRVQGLDRHSEASLARQVRAAARLALASLQRPTVEAESPRGPAAVWLVRPE